MLSNPDRSSITFSLHLTDFKVKEIYIHWLRRTNTVTEIRERNKMIDNIELDYDYKGNSNQISAGMLL
jgi:hypothetical protein